MAYFHPHVPEDKKLMFYSITVMFFCNLYPIVQKTSQQHSDILKCGAGYARKYINVSTAIFANRLFWWNGSSFYIKQTGKFIQKVFFHVFLYVTV